MMRLKKKQWLGLTFILLVTTTLNSFAIKFNHYTSGNSKPPVIELESKNQSVPKFILLGGFEGSELNSVLIEAVKPLKNKLSLNFVFTKGYEIQDKEESRYNLDKNKFNFSLAGGIKLFCFDATSNNNVFFDIGLYYSKESYNKTHFAADGWRYNPPTTFLGQTIVPGFWMPTGGHENNYHTNISAFGLRVTTGFQKIILKRFPIQLNVGLVMRNPEEEKVGYEAGASKPYQEGIEDYNQDPKIILFNYGVKVGFIF